MAETATQTDRRRSDPENRVKQLEADFKKDPSKGAVPLAEAYLSEGRANEALATLEKAEQAPQPERDVLKAQAHFDLFANDKAAAALEQAGKNHDLTQSERAQLLLGELAFESDKTAEAKEHLYAVRKVNPDNRRAAELLNNLGEDVEIPEAAEDPDAEIFGFQTEDPDAEKPGRAALHMILGAAAFAAIFGFYYWNSQRTAEARRLAQEARPLIEAGDTESLQLAAEKLEESVSIRQLDPALASLAEVYALLWVDHGMLSAQSKAERYSREAADANIQTGARYGAEALVAYGQKDYQGAVQLGERIREQGGSSEKLAFALGLAKRALGQHAEGREDLRRAQDLNSRAPHYAAALGDAYDADNDARNAAMLWEKAYKNNSSYVPGTARHLLGQLRGGTPIEKVQEKFERLESTDEALLGKRDQGAILLTKAALARRSDAAAEAAKALEQAQSLLGPTPRALAAHGHILLAQDEVDAGLEKLKSAASRSNGAKRYVYTLARAYATHERPKDAVKLLEEHADQLQKEADYQVALGNAHRAADQFDEAEAAYEKALELINDLPEAHLEQGRLAMAQNSYEAAAKHFEKAVAARSAFPEVYEAVGLLFLAQGSASAANTQWKQAEKQFLARGTDALRMHRFYDKVIGALSEAGSSSYVSFWQERQEEFQNQGS